MTTSEIIDQIHELILEDRRIWAKSIAEQLGISRERVGSIIHEDFGMRKLYAKWVPKCGGIAAHPAQKKSEYKNSLEKFSPRFFFFWDQDGILLVDYLPKGQTINAEYYLSLLAQLKDILKEKRRGKVTKGVLFLHDNAPAHRALATQKKLVCLGFQCLDHPPHSPNMAPSDYHLFPGLKKTIESSPFFVRRGGHCGRGDLVGRTKF